METQTRKSFFPKQFEPYDDKIDPNSVIKYRPKPTPKQTVEHFGQEMTMFNINILVSLFIILALVIVVSVQ